MKLYHYTREANFLEILKSGFLSPMVDRKATVKDEKPLLWLTSRESWEPTVCALSVYGVVISDETKIAEAYNTSLYRFVIESNDSMMNVNKAMKYIKLHGKHRLGFLEHFKNVNSDHKCCYATVDKFPIDALPIEKWDGVKWCSISLEDVKK